MSHDSAVPTEPTGPTGIPSTSGGRSWVAVVGSVVAVALIAGGGYAAWGFFFGGGPRPAEVLPASTFALVTVDLDPSGGQKVEAITTLRKLPSWRKRTGLTPDSDVMKVVFEKSVEDGPCSALDYERDVQPWIGQRAGFGGVRLGDGSAVPVLVLQVKDAEKAKVGVAKLVDCSQAQGDDFGWTVVDDYVVGSDSTEHAEAIASAGKQTPLSADAGFQKWTEEAGGAGIMNAYVGAKVVDVLSSEAGGVLGGGLLGGGLAPGGPAGAQKELTKAFENFKGAAATLRFADGGMELSMVGGGLGKTEGRNTGAGQVGEHVGALPADTAAAFALSVPPGGLEQLTSADGMFGEVLDAITTSTGLDLPDDLVTLFGDSVSFSVGGDAPADLDAVTGPQDVPIGLLVHGDDQKIRAVIKKVESRAGVSLSDLSVSLSSGDGKLALASSPDYAAQLLGEGSLADSLAFRSVVPELDRAESVGYVAFGDAWLSTLRKSADTDGDPEAAELMDNLAALRAFGISSWNEGETTRSLVRLSLR